MPLDRIVEPAAYGPEPDAGNYWRTTARPPEPEALEGPLNAEFAVIGAGYTGLAAALRLAEAGADVALVDAHGPAWGASGRNGGFCCLGGAALGDESIARRYGTAAARGYFAAERAAVDLVSRMLEEYGIEADRHSEGETLLAHAPARMADLTERAAEIRARYGIACRVHPREELAQLGMASPEFHGAVTVPVGFALNPLKYALGLARAAEAAGVRLFGRTPVTAIEPEAGRFRLRTPGGTLSAGRVVVATNGYSSEDVPAWLRARYLPVPSNILVTRPLSPDERAAQGWTSRQMCHDTRYHLHYFRLMPDDRMLFGVRGRARATPEDRERTRIAARADFERIFPAWAHVETPHFWQGLICASRKLAPYVGPAGAEGAWTALAYHGNGVAMSGLAGRMVADLALGRDAAVPEVMAAPLGRFPLGRHRRWLLWGAAHLHRAQDVVRSRQ
ncbi:MAG: FAD-dependent oxidoreductase [Deinococcus-Thermus bacterium]|jgi:glycine/D-amino acid oxidase-like deaminating enzyme|nr:FAD-dependent oxidoreductase [Deinococcota bacterium]